MVEMAYNALLLGSMLLLAALIIAGIIRSVMGPGISDRIIAVNMIGTIIIMLIAILSVYLDENYLVDVCLIYAMISFLGVVVLCKVYTGVYLQKRNREANLVAIQDNLNRQPQVRESASGGADTAAEGNGEAVNGGTDTAAEGNGEAVNAQIRHVNEKEGTS